MNLLLQVSFTFCEDNSKPTDHSLLRIVEYNSSVITRATNHLGHFGSRNLNSPTIARWRSSGPNSVSYERWRYRVKRSELINLEHFARSIRQRRYNQRLLINVQAQLTDNFVNASARSYIVCVLLSIWEKVSGCNSSAALPTFPFLKKYSI